MKKGRHGLPTPGVYWRKKQESPPHDLPYVPLAESFILLLGQHISLGIYNGFVPFFVAMFKLYQRLLPPRSCKRPLLLPPGQELQIVAMLFLGIQAFLLPGL